MFADTKSYVPFSKKYNFKTRRKKHSTKLTCVYVSPYNKIKIVFFLNKYVKCSVSRNCFNIIITITQKLIGTYQ